MTNNIKRIAELIEKLTYNEMMILADELETQVNRWQGKVNYAGMLSDLAEAIKERDR